MSLPFLADWRRSVRVGWPALCLGGLTLAGCGASHRPASSLAERDRTALADYEQIRAGLAQDDARTTRNGAVALMTTLKAGPADAATKRLLAQTQALLDARALDIQRQTFATLSASLVPLARGVDGYYIMTAPTGAGAEWIQRTTEVDNPYMGKVMHSTGTQEK